MNFSDQIKKVRTDNNLTQQQMADRLLVSRQAISNWENNRNLPDIEMLIQIALSFNVSLDELILGGRNMNNNMAEKLIKDGSDGKRASTNLKMIKIGVILFILGVVSFLCGLFGKVAWENTFVFMTYIFFFAGIITFLVTGLKNIVQFFAKKIK